MRKHRKAKQLLSVAAALSLMVTGTGVAGCGSVKKAEENSEEQDLGNSSKAMGRYLEEELPIPEGTNEIVDLQIQEDGTLGMLAGTGDGKIQFYKTADQGKTWKEEPALTEPENGFYEATLGKNGSVLAGEYVEGEDESSLGTMNYYYCPAGGQMSQLDLSALTGDAFPFKMKIGSNGNLYLMLIGNGVLEINPEEQKVVHEYEKGNYINYMSVTSEYLIVTTDGEVHYYNTETGKPVEGGDALTAQLKKDPKNLEQGNTSGNSILFADGDEKDSLFYADSSGLYRYVFGGNMLEQLVDGSLNSLSAPDNNFKTMTQDADGRFYISENDFSSGSGEGKVVAFTYSADTPTVPDTELTVYSLEENSSIRQAVVMFQKKYPDIYLTLETGMSGEDGITRTDALKTLNTEIMAGKGPDILILDGISAETYIKQGMLEDISGILKDAGLLSNIQEAYTEEDGSIYAMPVKFGIPLIEGKKEDVTSVTDLVSLADTVEQHKAEYGLSGEYFYKLPFGYSLYGRLLLEQLADDNSASWMKDDGTLDEEQIKEFLEQAGRIYQAGKDCVEELKKTYPDYFDDSQQPSYSRFAGIGGDVRQLFLGMNTFAAGGIFSPYDFAMVDSIAQTDTDLSYQLWNGQVANCFIPVNKVGISSGSSKKEASEKFVEYLFSEEGQQVSKTDGFPVAESVYDGTAYWDQGAVGTVLSQGSSENSETGQMITYEVKVPEEEKVSQLKNLGKTLTTPILDNAIIFSAVADAGEKYLNGEIGLDEAVAAVMQQANLYLAE